MMINKGKAQTMSEQTMDDQMMSAWKDLIPLFVDGAGNLFVTDKTLSADDTEPDDWIREAEEIEEKNERIKLEEEQRDKEKNEALLSEQEKISFDSDVGIAIYTPDNKKEEEEFIEKSDKLYESVIDKSIVLNGVQSFLNYSNHQFQKLINDNKDPEGWTAYENAMQDGFSDDDYEKHFHGIDHKIDYDYVKDGILKERELNEFRAQYPDIDTFTSATSFILAMLWLYLQLRR